jgi:hypothetical protein
VAEAILVEAAVPVVLSNDPNAPYALYKTNVANTWYYVARTARMSKDERGLYALSLVRRRVRERPNPNEPERLVTKGGVLAAQGDLSPRIFSADDVAAWTEAITRSGNGPEAGQTLRFLPMPLRGGTMSIGGISRYVKETAIYKDIPVGPSASVPITIDLNDIGADELWGFLVPPGQEQPNKPGLPINAQFTYKYTVIYPGCEYTVTADKHAAHNFFSLDAEARANYFDLAGFQTDIEVVRGRLRDSGAVRINWERKPAGFDPARIQQLENAILDAWAKSALTKMVDELSSDTEAENPEGYFRGVSIKLKSVDLIADLILVGHYEENLTADEVFVMPLNMAAARGLKQEDYGVEVNDENVLSVTINFGGDARILRYSGQYGWTRPDGATFTGVLRDAEGAKGAILPGVLQYQPIPGQLDPPEKRVDIKYEVDWANAEWEDQSINLMEQATRSGLSLTINPCNFIAHISIFTDLERSAPGTLSLINWRTSLAAPDGRAPKNYASGFVVVGAGPEGRLPVEEKIEFPYYPGEQEASTFEWDVTTVKPDGTVLVAQERFPLTRATAIVLTAHLKEQPPGIVRPRVVTPLRVLSSLAREPDAPGRVRKAAR